MLKHPWLANVVHTVPHKQFVEPLNLKQAIYLVRGGHTLQYSQMKELTTRLIELCSDNNEDQHLSFKKMDNEYGIDGLHLRICSYLRDMSEQSFLYLLDVIDHH